MSWLAGLSARVVAWGLLALLLAATGTVSGAYLLGRADGKAGCALAQTRTQLKNERQAREDHDAIDARTPRGGDVDADHRFMRDAARRLRPEGR